MRPSRNLIGSGGRQQLGVEAVPPIEDGDRAVETLVDLEAGFGVALAPRVGQELHAVGADARPSAGMV